MHELMAVADLVITKPGGLTSSEALAVGKPLLIVNPIPGQEAANSDFLLERGAAAKVNRVEDLPFRLGQLFGSAKLAQMARAAKALGRPRAAQDICEEVLRRAELAKHRCENG
jgi:processive 1,2-diacylglycerol beta-glucosyltransferase